MTPPMELTRGDVAVAWCVLHVGVKDLEGILTFNNYYFPGDWPILREPRAAPPVDTLEVCNP